MKLMNGSVVIAEASLFTYDEAQKAWFDGMNSLYADTERAFTVMTGSSETDWLIDIGPFFDRFGPAKMAVLTSPDAGVKAIVQDAMVRKWLDLEREDLHSSIDYIMSKVPAVTAELKVAILTTPVTFEEQRALLKVYFS